MHSHRSWRAVLLLWVALMLAAPMNAIAQVGAEPDAATPMPSGTRIVIGDRAFFLACQGTGSPTVILESGLNDGAAAWAAVQSEVAQTTRVCSYDRANVHGGASDSTTGELRPASELVTDLHALLEEASIPGPYVLVGHSVGGLLVRLFAATYPDKVVGMVLVDATHENYYTRLEALVGPDLWAALLYQFAQAVAQGALEPIDLETTVAQVQAATRTTPLPPMPLVVLSHARPFTAAPPDWPVTAEDHLWGALQDQLVELVPGGQHVVAAGSGHDIHRERPDLVVTAIGDVVESVRHPGTWRTVASETPTISTRLLVRNDATARRGAYRRCRSRNFLVLADAVPSDKVTGAQTVQRVEKAEARSGVVLQQFAHFCSLPSCCRARV